MVLKSSMATVKIVLTIVLATGIAGLAIYKVIKDPSFFEFSKGKLSSTLSPARDLRGTWVSSLSGKGMQLTGQFTTADSTTTVYEDGDIELIINDVKDNVAYGTIRYTNLCAWGFTIVPKIGQVSVPKNCVAEMGPTDVAIKVSSSALDFGTITVGGVTATMTGSFITDFIHGTMTATVEPYGALKGLFNLNRQR